MLYYYFSEDPDWEAKIEELIKGLRMRLRLWGVMFIIYFYFVKNTAIENRGKGYAVERNENSSTTHAMATVKKPMATVKKHPKEWADNGICIFTFSFVPLCFFHHLFDFSPCRLFDFRLFVFRLFCLFDFSPFASSH
jgi:hypothetical protein